MNAVLPRVLKSAYRKEPLISIFMTIGVVDALIGGLDDSWSLFAFGLGALGVALTFKLWRMQQRPPVPEEPQTQEYYLPAQSSSSALPMLSVSKKKPPQ